MSEATTETRRGIHHKMNGDLRIEIGNTDDFRVEMKTTDEDGSMLQGVFVPRVVLWMAWAMFRCGLLAWAQRLVNEGERKLQFRRTSKGD